MLIFSGGTGTPKLIRGMTKVFDSDEINIVANTGDDIWITNHLVCPDLDSLLYTLINQIDDKKWWGIKNDSFVTHDFLKKLGFDEFMKIGDKDRAIHLMRTKLIKENHSLTEAVEKISNKLGIEADLFPMTNDSVNTIITTSSGERLHFQRWWINQSEKEIRDVEFEGIDEARASRKFKNKLKKEHTIIIGPSNPITSIYPIISLGNVKKKLKQKKVIAISPFIGKQAFSGPAPRLMKTFGYEPSSQGLAELYENFLDELVVDKTEKLQPENSTKANIIMNNEEDEIKLARFLKRRVKSEY